MRPREQPGHDPRAPRAPRPHLVVVVLPRVGHGGGAARKALRAETRDWRSAGTRAGRARGRTSILLAKATACLHPAEPSQAGHGRFFIWLEKTSARQALLVTAPLPAPPLPSQLPPHWLHALVVSPSIGREDAARPVAIVTSRPSPRPGPWRDGGRRWGWRGARCGAGTRTGTRTGTGVRARGGAGVGGTAAHRAAAAGTGRTPRLPARPVAAGGARGQDPGPPPAQGRPPPPPAGADGQGGPRWAPGVEPLFRSARGSARWAAGEGTPLLPGEAARQEWAGLLPASGGDGENDSYLVPWSASHSLEPVAAWFGRALMPEHRGGMFQ